MHIKHVVMSHALLGSSWQSRLYSRKNYATYFLNTVFSLEAVGWWLNGLKCQPDKLEVLDSSPVCAAFAKYFRIFSSWSLMSISKFLPYTHSSLPRSVLDQNKSQCRYLKACERHLKFKI